MSLNEVKLTVAIEDPTKREQKEYMGIEVCALFPHHAGCQAFWLLTAAPLTDILRELRSPFWATIVDMQRCLAVDMKEQYMPNMLGMSIWAL